MASFLNGLGRDILICETTATLSGTFLFSIELVLTAPTRFNFEGCGPMTHRWLGLRELRY
jgi:hypothetical protein